MAERLGKRVGLVAPFDVLATGGGILTLLLLLPIEIFADKIPRADVFNDRLGFVYRPLAGAVAMAAVTHETALSTSVAALIGGVVAFALHLLKRFYRRPLAPLSRWCIPTLPRPSGKTRSSAGIAVVAFIVPPLSVAMVVGIAVLMGWIGVSLRRRTGGGVAPQP